MSVSGGDTARKANLAPVGSSRVIDVSTMNNSSKLCKSRTNIILLVFVAHGMSFYVICCAKKKLSRVCWLSIIQYDRMRKCLEKCLPCLPAWSNLVRFSQLSSPDTGLSA